MVLKGFGGPPKKQRHLNGMVTCSCHGITNRLCLCCWAVCQSLCRCTRLLCIWAEPPQAYLGDDVFISVNSPPILEPVLVGIGMFTGGTIRILTHGQITFDHGESPKSRQLFRISPRDGICEVRLSPAVGSDSFDSFERQKATRRGKKKKKKLPTHKPSSLF